MKIASVAHVKAKFSAYVSASEDAPVIITRNGKAVAAIVPLADDDDVERLMLSYSPRLRAILSNARKRIRSGQKVSHDDFWGQLANSGARNARRKTA